ncbi:dethiobiotin synthase [Pseudonocardia parietis]|uniref:ATP-dependent dethiobiotin synthetase BioD n=1 Tax=Pseudonocardia parietis TaxID=570936 RepID=A0ABS4VNM0_9PSEU|nr:dethiobiotin synthase [Pseudonocardia parietis]
MSVLVVTGTDTGVGKTIVTAALAAALLARGDTVAVFKPTQAGTEDGRGDIDVVSTLAGVGTAVEGIRLPDPMAPVAAARRAEVTLPDLGEHVAAVEDLAARHDHVLVEGAGGLLVELDGHGRTLADLAAALSVPAVVVCRSGLGTLNHTALTVEALTRRRIPVAGLVIGAWPAVPSEIERSNRAELEHAQAAVSDRASGALLGAVPEGAGRLDPARFRAEAPGWIRPPFGLAPGPP